MTTLLAQAATAINQVGGFLPDYAIDCAGAGCFMILAESAFNELQWIVIPLATIFIIYAAFQLLTNSDEEQITKARKMVGTAAAGIALVVLTPRIYAGFFGGGAAWVGGAGAVVICEELLGFFRWAEVVVTVLAVLFIILAGLQVVMSYGSEDGITGLRRTVVGVIFGILLLVNKWFLLPAFGIGECLLVQPNASVALNRVFIVINGLLGFLALAAAVVLVYAGIIMILSVGKEDTFNKAKGLFIRALVGLVVVLTSLVLIRFVLTAIGA